MAIPHGSGKYSPPVGNMIGPAVMAGNGRLITANGSISNAHRHLLPTLPLPK